MWFAGDTKWIIAGECRDHLYPKLPNESEQFAHLKSFQPRSTARERVVKMWKQVEVCYTTPFHGITRVRWWAIDYVIITRHFYISYTTMLPSCNHQSPVPNL